MTSQNALRLEPVEWLPAERLGQLDVDARMRPWLIGKGLLGSRMKASLKERFGSHLLDQWTCLLSEDQKACLRAQDSAGLFRDEELCCAGQVWVFTRTVVPDSTLCLHPWLGEMGECCLGELLADLPGVEQSSYEYAWLPVADPLTARALREADLRPAGLWSRRSRILLRGRPLLSQEVFLPSMGRTPTGS